MNLYLEVVQPRRGIVDISPVPERIQLEEVEIPCGIHAGGKPAPRVVIVFYHLVSIAVNNGDDIALQIVDVMEAAA